MERDRVHFKNSDNGIQDVQNRAFSLIWRKHVNILYEILKFACCSIPLGVISDFHLTSEALWFHT